VRGGGWKNRIEVDFVHSSKHGVSGVRGCIGFARVGFLDCLCLLFLSDYYLSVSSNNS
jgi:hypothetical protein